MAVLSVLFQNTSKSLVPWMVFQADPDISFLDLFIKITSGGISVVAPSAELAEAEVEQVFVGSSRECMQW